MNKLIFCSCLSIFLLRTISVVEAQHCGYIHQKNENIERYTEGYVRNFENSARPRTVVKIPVVVHIVWRTIAENLPEAQIRGQIDSLTKDFRKKNTDANDIPSQLFRSVAADCDIEFCLAVRDTLGNPTSGIVRKQTSIVNIGGQFAATTRRKVLYSEFGGDNAWRPDHYLNIWVCAFDEGGINGVTTSLAMALERPEEDGCVINYRAFGVSPNNFVGRNKGRTLVHEVGHYFNLIHIWGNDTSCNDDDEVEDTPRQARLNSFCPTFPTTPSCPGNTVSDMFMNYMDYPYDECVLMFTKGQKARMWAALDGFRKGLILRGLSCDPFVATNTVFEPQWSISPNPASSILTIQFPADWRNRSKMIQLTDIAGRVLIKKEENTEGVLLSVENVPNGLYFVRLTIDNQVFTKKIIVAK